MSVYNLKKVQSGDPLKIPAATFNTFIDAARDHLQRSHDSGARLRSHFDQTGIILIRNDSGEDRSIGEIMELRGCVITPTDDRDAFRTRPILKGRKPETYYAQGGHKNKFVVLLEPIAPGELGRACIDGLCTTQIDITDVGHRFGEVINNDCSHLKSSSTSGTAQIIWSESQTGLTWAVVRLGLPTVPGFWAYICDSGGNVAGSNGTDDWPLDSGMPYGQYISEIDPKTCMCIYPSRTRDEDGNYIQTVATNLDCAGDYFFSPIPCGRVFVMQQDDNLNTRLTFDRTPPPVAARITSVESTDGYQVRFRFMGNTAMTPFYAINRNYPASGERLYPFPKVDDKIMVARNTGHAWPPTNCYFYDLTPRIPVDYAAWGAGSHNLFTSGGSGARGDLWHVDT